MIFPREESSGEINKKYCKRWPGGVKLPGLFLPFLQKKNLKWSLLLTFISRFKHKGNRFCWYTPGMIENYHSRRFLCYRKIFCDVPITSGRILYYKNRCRIIRFRQVQFQESEPENKQEHKYIYTPDKNISWTVSHVLCWPDFPHSPRPISNISISL